MVKPGDAIEAEGALITLETEKATMDVPSTAAGVVREVKVQRGSRVSKGDVIALVESSDTSPAQAGESRVAGEGRKAEPSPQPSPAKPEEGAKPSPPNAEVGAKPTPQLS